MKYSRSGYGICICGSLVFTLFISFQMRHAWASMGGEGFVYAAGIGASLPVSKKSSLDIGLRFENWSYGAGTDRFVALRAAYSFGL